MMAGLEALWILVCSIVGAFTMGRWLWRKLTQPAQETDQ